MLGLKESVNTSGFTMKEKKEIKQASLHAIMNDKVTTIYYNTNHLLFELDKAIKFKPWEARYSDVGTYTKDPEINKRKDALLGQAKKKI